MTEASLIPKFMCLNLGFDGNALHSPLLKSVVISSKSVQLDSRWVVKVIKARFYEKAKTVFWSYTKSCSSQVALILCPHWNRRMLRHIYVADRVALNNRNANRTKEIGISCHSLA